MSLWFADFLGVQGIFDGNVNFPSGVVDRHAVVLVSICELRQPQGEPLDFPFKGLAVFTLHNGVPFDSGNIEITIDTGWNAFPINVRMFFLVNPG